MLYSATVPEVEIARRRPINGNRTQQTTTRLQWIYEVKPHVYEVQQSKGTGDNTVPPTGRGKFKMAASKLEILIYQLVHSDAIPTAIPETPRSNKLTELILEASIINFTLPVRSQIIVTSFLRPRNIAIAD